MGHVNNANHLSYIELARINYFEEVAGMDTTWTKQEGIILAHISIDYRTPLFIHDAVFVYTRCSKLGKKSIELSWKIIREKEKQEEVIAEGTSVLVYFDYATHQSIEIPEEQRKRIETYEGF